MNDYVLIVGNLSDGFEVIGPFENEDAACEWDMKNNPCGTGWITEVHEPKQFHFMPQEVQRLIG